MLDQLPVDLRQEIMQHYSNQAAVAANTRNKATNPPNSTYKSVPNAFDKLLNHKSPVKNISPVKKRRGRPAKSSITAKKNSNKSTKSVKRSITPTVTENTNLLTDDEGSKDKEYKEDKAENNQIEEEKYVPTFCGKSDLQDIRPLIKVKFFL